MKRVSIFIALLFAACSFVLATPANQTKGGVNYVYNSDYHAYVASSYDSGSGLSSIEILAKLNVDGVSYSVEAVADNAFKDCTTLTTVTLPLTLKTIGVSAFEGCTGLTSIRFPGSLASVGKAAFKGCTALTGVTFDGLPTGLEGTGDEAVFAGVGSVLSPVILSVPAAVYAAKVYKNGEHWGGYFIIVPIIPAATQTIDGVVFKYKESIKNDAFGVDLEQPCYVVDGFDAEAADAKADVVVPTIISGLPVLAIYSLTDPMIRSIEIDTLFSYTVSGQDYPLIMNIEDIKEVADLPDNLAFSGLGTEANPVDVYVPSLDDAMNIIFNFAYQVGSAKGGYLNVWGRQHREKGVVYNYNREKQYYTADAFDVKSAIKTTNGDDYTYQLEIIGELKEIFPVKEVSENAFNAVNSTPNYNAEVAYIDRLVLPDMLENINNYAFRSLSNVSEVVIPASVKKIGSCAFLSLGSSKQGTQVVTFIGTPESIADNSFNVVGQSTKHAKLLCPKEDVEKYTALGTSLFGGYFDIVANTRKLTLTSADDKILEVKGAGDYTYLSNVEISATVLDEGYEFTGWSDGVMSAKRTILLDRDSTITTTIAIHKFNITTSVNDLAMGYTDGDGNYDYKQAVTLTAIAEEGYHFVNWNDNPELNNAELNINVPLNGGNYKAVFAPNQYAVTVTTNYPEKCSATGSGTYDYKQKVTLNTTGPEGYEFIEWSDGVKTATREVEVPIGGLALTANYRLLGQYTVTALYDASMGKTTGSGSGFEHDVIHITAIPNEGYKFIGWSDEVTDAERDITIAKENVTLTAMFEAIDYVITGAVNDAGMGSVEGALGYQAYNSQVIIEAKSKYGYHFVEWEDGSTDAVRTITVPLNGGTYTATFAIDMFTLVAQAEDSESGEVKGGGEYPYNSVVEIEAVANPGYEFSGWKDGFKKTTKRTITLSIDGDTYIAIFEPLDYEVKTAVNNKTMGVVEGASIYPYNKEITLTATPNEGYHFAHWEDGSTDAVRTLRVPLNGGTFTATFEPNIYEITVEVVPAKGGYVEGAGEYPYKTRVNLNAVAYEGFTFKQWADNNSTKANRSISMPLGGFAFTAEFTPEQFEVKTASNNPDWGTTSGDGVFDYLSKTTIEATPKQGYRFVMWEDGSISAQRTITVPLNGATYNAIFAAETFTIEVKTSDLAKGTALGSGDYENGQQVEIEAVANEGYEFTQWSDGDKNAKRTITVSGEATYIAYFGYKSYEIVANANDEVMGVVTGGGTYQFTDNVTLTATPNEGYHFVEWEDKSTETTRVITVAVGGGSYTATFAPNQYEIKVESENTDMGAVEGGGMYDFYSEVEISAIANDGYHFVEWNDGDKNATRKVTVPLNGATFTAKFAINIYTVTLTSSDEIMGSVTGGGEYEYKAEATLTAIANEGYHFTAWSDGVETATRIVIVEEDITLSASFAANEYTLTLVADGEGTVTGAGTYKYGDQVDITAVPAEGYKFMGWSDEESEATRTITISSDLTLTAKFEQITYILTLLVNDETMGSVTGAGEYAVNTEIEIKAIANEHFRFVSWSDGNTDAERTITLTEDQTLTANFEIDYTAVENVKQSMEQVRKILIDGHVFIIMPDGKIYDVNGRMQ